jgi:hypothetical protein
MRLAFLVLDLPEDPWWGVGEIAQGPGGFCRYCSEDERTPWSGATRDAGQAGEDGWTDGGLLGLTSVSADQTVLSVWS